MKDNKTTIWNDFHITKQRISYRILSLNQFKKPSTSCMKKNNLFLTLNNYTFLGFNNRKYRSNAPL